MFISAALFVVVSENSFHSRSHNYAEHVALSLNYFFAPYVSNALSKEEVSRCTGALGIKYIVFDHAASSYHSKTFCKKLKK